MAQKNHLKVVSTDIPARMDRLPWSRWHWLVVFALGITWLLDGLEVTIKGAVSGALQDSRTLGLSNAQIGFAATAYLAGSVSGALFFGYLTDRLGRKKLFTLTLSIYLTATALTAFSWDLWSFAIFRFFTGAGIGGEYAAINSAIDELIPARVRGWTDLAINSSFWLGTALGSIASVFLLDERLIPVNLGWRFGFGIGALLGLVIVVMRRFLPESPRWLMTHGRIGEAEEIVADIEEKVRDSRQISSLPPPIGLISVHLDRRIGFRDMIKAVLGRYARRSLLGLSLMVSQAFFYNGISFTYPLILMKFYGVHSDMVGWYLLPFAIGNFAGPLTIGRLFDTIGRKPMITITYALSGILLAMTGYLFMVEALSVTAQSLCFMLIFFIASSAASSAYLTVSEIFPVEARAISIAFFYALGTGIGGLTAPLLFGIFIESGSRGLLFCGYLIGSFLMLAAALMEHIFGIKAERKPLEDIAPPLTSTSSDELDEPHKTDERAANF